VILDMAYIGLPMDVWVGLRLCCLSFVGLHLLLFLEAVEKKGGDSHQPIGSVHCITIWGGLPGGAGRTKQKFQASFELTTVRQKPSLMSHFAKSNGPFCGDIAATAAISLGAAFPDCFIGSGGACITVAALMLGSGIPPTWISKEKSSMARYG